MSQVKEAVTRGSPQELKHVLNIQGEDVGLDVSAFGGKLSSSDTTVQAMADTLDDAFATTATESAEGLLEKATDAEIQASTTGAKAICAEDLKTAAALASSLSDAATISVDWSAFVYDSVTITADRILGNPTNEVEGQSRKILVKGDSATPRTLTFGTEYLGDVPSLTDITSTVWYVVMIFCVGTSHFSASAKKVKG